MLRYSQARVYVGGVVVCLYMALRNNLRICEFDDGELLQRSMTQLSFGLPGNYRNYPENSRDSWVLGGET